MEQYKSEASLQSTCYMWWHQEFGLKSGQLDQLFMVYNNPPDKRMGGILKSMGLRRGVPDLFYFAPYGRRVWIELKLPGRTQTDEQIQFELRCKKWGDEYYVIDTFDDFKKLIYGYQ